MIRCGIDLMEIGRIERVIARYGKRFLDRIYTPAEQAECKGNARRLTLRWAAKEAAVKALGTGIGPVGWLEVEVETGPLGRPRLILHGRALALARAQRWRSWDLSLTDTDTHVMACVVVLTDEEPAF